MANGFLTSSPSARHGSTVVAPGANIATAQKFTAPGSGVLEISEIGLWCRGNSPDAGYLIMAIFDHDAPNDCPESIVVNSGSAEIMTPADNTVAKRNHLYATKPQINGGSVYWITVLTKDAIGRIDINTTGGSSLTRAATYPTWPTGTEWHTHTDRAYDHGIYAVYSEAGVLLPRLERRRRGIGRGILIGA